MAENSSAAHAVTAEQLDAFMQAWLALQDAANKGRRSGSGELLERLTTHLGTDPMALETATEQILVSDRVNQQLAIDAFDADAELLGLDPHVGQMGPSMSLKTLLGDNPFGHGDMGPVSWSEHPVDVDEQLRCASAGIWLTRLDGTPVAIALWASDEHRPNGANIRIEAISPDVETSQRALQALAELRATHNVYRGKTLGFVFSEYGEFGLHFIAPQPVTRGQLILPPDDLSAIERHTIGLSEKADELRTRGRHLKRGLLLYGPPGTGKTHTVSYLINSMPGRTTIVLQGPSAGAIGQAAAIARAFPPATIVIEDVDLIAYDRGMGMGDNPMLFQLLNEMDGFADDSDLLFVLTTNRAEILEPALASRPGRIDQAVEISKPDPAARRRLLELYLQDIDHKITSFDSAIERLDGVTASFVKELARRAVMASIDEDAVLDDQMLDAAITDLLEHSSPITQRSLGVGNSPMDDGHTSYYMDDDMGEDGMHFDF